MLGNDGRVQFEVKLQLQLILEPTVVSELFHLTINLVSKGPNLIELSLNFRVVELLRHLVIRPRLVEGGGLINIKQLTVFVPHFLDQDWLDGSQYREIHLGNFSNHRLNSPTARRVSSIGIKAILGDVKV